MKVLGEIVYSFRSQKYKAIQVNWSGKFKGSIKQECLNYRSIVFTMLVIEVGVTYDI